MARQNLQKTSFRYDMMPWKLVFCVHTLGACIWWEETDWAIAIPLTSLPPSPEPGRVPEGCDHVHIVPKLSGDQRNAREEEKWAALVRATARCEHGRLSTDLCRQCPFGRAPDVTGKRIGTTATGAPVLVPEFEQQGDIKAWTRS